MSQRLLDSSIAYYADDLDSEGAWINTRATRMEAFQIYNNDTTPTYVRLYNSEEEAATIADTPVKKLMIPAQSGANMGGLKVEFPDGVYIRATKGFADDDETDPSEDTLVVNIDYRNLA